MNRFKDKKVLIFGLGILGGGVSVTNWLLKQGAQVTVTDLKNQEQLADSIKKINGRVEFRLGGHIKEDIAANDIIVINPDVSIRSEFIRYAFELGKEVVNEAIIFFREFGHPIIGVTGTRGKTTTVAWTEFFLSSLFRSSIAGNSTTHPYLTVLDKKDDLEIAVAEVPSFQLELADKVPIAPYIAVITNISQDHLNRHGTMEEYARVKSLWFRHQESHHHCVLNADDKWVYFLLSQKTCDNPWYFSMKPLRPGLSGVWHVKDAIYFHSDHQERQVLTLDDSALALGEHNIANLMASAMAAHLAGVEWEDIQRKIKSLPSVPFRQEIIFADDKLSIINDTTATSPEGAIQALKRFGGLETVLITGGTDRQLDFAKWAEVLKQNIQPGNVVFLAGSATDKMLIVLDDWSAAAPVCDTLEECVDTAFKKTGNYSKSVLLFSPASKSFEKFKNEFDRGEQFNVLVKKYLG